MAPDADVKATVLPEDSLVDVRLKKTDSGLVLLAVNRTDESKEVVFSIPGLENKNVSGRFEGRVLQPADGEFKDEFAPYGTHVYDIK